MITREIFSAGSHDLRCRLVREWKEQRWPRGRATPVPVRWTYTVPRANVLQSQLSSQTFFLLYHFTSFAQIISRRLPRPYKPVIMGFWKGWESWEKMVFVLACAMVVVVIIGGGVAWVNRWKTKLYNKAFNEEAERARSIWQQHGRFDDVPFGARALESGVQIDGIYTPGQHTPRHSITRQSTAESSVWRATPSPLTPTVSRSSQQQHRGPISPI